MKSFLHQPGSFGLPRNFWIIEQTIQTLKLEGHCAYIYTLGSWKILPGHSMVNCLTFNKPEHMLKGHKGEFERKGSKIQNPRNTGRGSISKSLRQKPRRSCACLQEEIIVWNWDFGNQTLARCKWTELWRSSPKHKLCLGEYPGKSYRN